MSRRFISSVALLVAVSCSAAAQTQDDVVSQYLVRLLSQHPAVRAKNFDQLAADRLVTAAWMQFLPTPSVSANKGPVSTSSTGAPRGVDRVSDLQGGPIHPIWD